MRNYGIERDPEMLGSTSRSDFRIRICRFRECELAAGWPTGSEDSERAYRTPDGAVEIVFNAFRESEDAEREGTLKEEDTPAAITGLGFAIARTVEAPDRIRAAVLGKVRRYGELRG